MLQKVENFRDAALENMQQKRIFRSATLDLATENDIERIVHELGVRTIIDLRGRGESIKKVGNDGHIHDHFDTLERKLVKLDLASALRNAIWASLSWWSRLEFVVYRLLGWKRYAHQKALTNSILGKEGLYGLNMGILDHATEYLRIFFDEMAKEETYPCIIHCSAGKDRTGLTIALLQSLCGVPREKIIESYSLSAKLLNMERISLEVGKMGLGPEFADSNPITMEKTFAYIDAKYGSVPQYLQSIGVSKQQQEKIISLISLHKSRM
jgi:protein tyrosine/serine phosphatase